MVEVSQPGERSVDDAVLDAARDCVLGYGVRRTTLTDVARRAGVSRMTVYRRWPDVQSLIGSTLPIAAQTFSSAPVSSEAQAWLEDPND